MGNGDTWNPKFRSPHGGDNLFLSSIVALKPETGKFLWYYQETPRDQWDVERDTPWGRMTYIDYRHRVEFGAEEYAAIDEYADPDSPRHTRMVEVIRKHLGLSTLKYQRLEDMIDAIGLDNGRMLAGSDTASLLFSCPDIKKSPPRFVEFKRGARAPMPPVSALLAVLNIPGAPRAETALLRQRVSALYELFFALELVLSGRLVPLTLMPAWVQQLAWYLPFQWTFYFPIEALVGNLSPARLLVGLGMQLLWITVGMFGVNIVWRFGIKQYSAVGN